MPKIPYFFGKKMQNSPQASGGFAPETPFVSGGWADPPDPQVVTSTFVDGGAKYFLPRAKDSIATLLDRT